MTRRVIFGVVLLSVAGSAVSALADSRQPRALTHEVCIVTSQDANHHTSQDYCVTWPGPVLNP
ncbi:MAG TPA: hypothetical protein VFJ17_04210 [Mycobacteriales bacterium]|jgi:hypothetical protein|nr:hypothetical protein [Mycobacteriales bacterium]